MRGDPTQKHDLSMFDAANAAAKKGNKLSWDKRVELIERQFPNVLTLDWKKAFAEDIDLFAWIMQDILKADGASAGRSGPKPSVDYKTAAVRLRQMMGEDYSTSPFIQAFATLAGARSMTSLARKTGLSRSQVHRLMRGEADPTAHEIEQIAKGFDKPPGYFLEYRKGLVMAAIADKLDRYPEASVKYWREIALAAS